LGWISIALRGEEVVEEGNEEDEVVNERHEEEEDAEERHEGEDKEEEEKMELERLFGST